MLLLFSFGCYNYIFIFAASFNEQISSITIYAAVSIFIFPLEVLGKTVLLQSVEKKIVKYQQ